MPEALSEPTLRIRRIVGEGHSMACSVQNGLYVHVGEVALCADLLVLKALEVCLCKIPFALGPLGAIFCFLYHKPKFGCCDVFGLFVSHERALKREGQGEVGAPAVTSHKPNCDKGGCLQIDR